MKKYAFIYAVILLLAACKQYENIGEVVFEKNSFKFALIGDWGREGSKDQLAVAKQLNRISALTDISRFLYR